MQNALVYATTEDPVSTPLPRVQAIRVRGGGDVWQDITEAADEIVDSL